VCGVQVSNDLLEEHLRRITHDDAECTDTDAGKCAAPSSAFRLDDPLIPELLSWISCAAVLGGLAGSVAVASCCEAIGRAKGAPVTSVGLGYTRVLGHQYLYIRVFIRIRVYMD